MRGQRGERDRVVKQYLQMQEGKKRKGVVLTHHCLFYNSVLCNLSSQQDTHQLKLPQPPGTLLAALGQAAQARDPPLPWRRLCRRGARLLLILLGRRFSCHDHLHALVFQQPILWISAGSAFNSGYKEVV